jgi:hypothetical protein
MRRETRPRETGQEPFSCRSFNLDYRFPDLPEALRKTMES